MAPFLENRVLRKIVQTFTNDPRNDFSKWANNPLVIRMLTKAKEMMDEGRMSEDEAEHLILKQLNVRPCQVLSRTRLAEKLDRDGIFSFYTL